MVSIPGGTFKMGRNTGSDNQRPEHEVTVEDFVMDKTEVTNAAFLEFMIASEYKPSSEEKFLAHWEKGKPIEGDENTPVRYVNIEDIKSFADRRSERGGVEYRLPTEQEWEYAARNGSKGNLYPWGDKFESRCAVIDQPTNDPSPVGSKICENVWGVVDLIGNVFEWTSSEPSLYPGSTGEIRPLTEPYRMLRGGGAIYKSTGPNAITSTFRIEVPASRRSSELGFRLVRSE
jgi:formylglycine-generating enzyme required for sulfatase activity